jgi:hypothetical protein
MRGEWRRVRVTERRERLLSSVAKHFHLPDGNRSHQHRGWSIPPCAGESRILVRAGVCAWCSGALMGVVCLRCLFPFELHHFESCFPLFFF